MGLINMGMSDLFTGRRISENESEWTRNAVARGEAILVDGSAEKRKALEAERKQTVQPVEPADITVERAEPVHKQQPERKQKPLPPERKQSLEEMAHRIGAKRRK
jgi:hypothetical protein